MPCPCLSQDPGITSFLEVVPIQVPTEQAISLNIPCNPLHCVNSPRQGLSSVRPWFLTCVATACYNMNYNDGRCTPLPHAGVGPTLKSHSSIR